MSGTGRDQYGISSESLNSASPGFTFGKSGNVSANTWLWNENVASNVTGRNISLTDAEIVEITIANGQLSTFDLEIYEHDGTTFTLLATVSLVSQRSKTVSAAISVTKDKELAAKIVNGSAKNPVAQVIIRGTL